jgi:hypothetical protein
VLPPFKYFDKGSMATIGYRAAVADAFGMKFTGPAAYIMWSIIHMMYLIGWGNRLPLSETIMRRDRGEHERVGIDSTPCRATLICWWMQRGARGVEGGEGTPPTEEVAGRQRARGHDRTSAHKVNPDVPPIRFGTGVIKDGDGRWGGAASVAQIHHEVADNASPGIEQMQLRLAPVQ